MRTLAFSTILAAATCVGLLSGCASSGSGDGAQGASQGFVCPLTGQTLPSPEHCPMYPR